MPVTARLNFAKELNELADDLSAGRATHLEGVDRFSRIRVAMDDGLGRYTDAQLCEIPENAEWKAAYERAWNALDTVFRHGIRRASQTL